MAHDKLLNIFENVGLGQKHLSIYLYLLEFGPKKASQLAVFLRLNRSVTYDYLEELVSFNLIVLLPDFKVNTYMANPPESLKSMLESQVYKNKRYLFELDTVLPELNLLQSKCDKVTQVVFYKGRSNCITFFKDLFSKPSVSIVKVIVGPMNEDDGTLTLLYELLAKYKPSVQEIHCVNGDMSPETRKYITKCLKVNPNHQFRINNFKNINCELVLRGDKFYMYNYSLKFGELPHVVDIQSKGLAKLQHQMFDILWAQAREFDI